MKKAQILSAIALAFALGVTPVIATVNTASAFTVEDTDKDIDGSATLTDVNNAIAAVKANVTYKNMMALYDAIEELGETDSEYAQIEASDITTISKAITAIDNTASVKFYTDLSTDITNEKTTVTEAVAKAVSQAKTFKYYNRIAPVFEAVNANDNEGDKAALIKAIQVINKDLEKKGLDAVIITENTATIASLTADAKTAFNRLTDSATNTGYTYDNYELLYNAVDYAETTNAKYKAGLTAFTNALEGSGVLTNDGMVAYANVKKIQKSNIKLSALADLANAPSYMNNYTDWTGNQAGDVRYELENAENGAINADSISNYNLVIKLAQAYADATNNGTQTVEQVAATLVGYKAPAAQNTVSEGPVTVTGAFPADLKLSVVKSDKKVAAFGDAKYAMWDINLIDANQKVVTYNGSVMVTIEVPKDLDAAKSSVYFVTDEGKVEKLAARVENGKMVFTVSHFSLYAIVEDNGKNFGINAPDTGIVMNTEAGASTTVAMVAGVATALTAAGAGVVAYRNARRSTRK